MMYYKFVIECEPCCAYDYWYTGAPRSHAYQFQKGRSPIMSSYISDLCNTYPVSGIRKMFDLAAGKTDLINLCNGEPNFDTPENIKQAAIRDIAADDTRYAPEGGLPAFRKAVADKYVRQFGKPFTEQNIMAAAGGVEGVILSFMTILNPGDEVIIPDPAYTCYEGQARLVGAKVVRVPLREEYGFKLQPEDLEAAITPRTRIVLLNYPSNPVGAVLTPEAGATLAEVIVRHDLIVISDEVYENILFDGRQHYSIAQAPGMEQRTLIVNSLSKTYAMTGWRVGYVVSSNLEIMTRMVKMQQALISCLPGFVMAAGAEAISGSQAAVEEMSRQYAHRRNLMYSLLSEVPGFKVFKTEGSFCVFINIKDYHIDSFEFCKELLENARVMTVPGTAFGSQGQGYIRMCFANSDENIIEGCKRIKEYLERRGM